MGGFKRKTISKIGLNALNYVDAVTSTAFTGIKNNFFRCKNRREEERIQ